MAKMKISLSNQKMTVLFSASPWRGMDPVIYTEYVFTPIDDEQEALRLAVVKAADRESKVMNKDHAMVAAQMMRTKKVLAISDGFVSMTASRKIQRRKL